jgi:hypothetical protein
VDFNFVASLICRVFEAHSLRQTDRYRRKLAEWEAAFGTEGLDVVMAPLRPAALCMLSPQTDKI